MTFDAFVGLVFFNFLMAWLLLTILPFLADIFPHDPRAIKIDFKQHD